MTNKFGGRRQLIDVDQIVEVALKMGVDNLSMHAVARELGVSTTALYRYVDSRDALLDACMDFFCQKLELPDPKLPWQEYLLEIGQAFREALIASPGACVYGVKIGPTTPAAFRVIDAALGVLQRHGFTPHSAWTAYSMVVDHAFTTVQKLENLAVLEADNGPGGYRVLQLTEEELLDFPHLAQSLAVRLPASEYEAFYLTQLRAIIAGIDAEFERTEVSA